MTGSSLIQASRAGSSPSIATGATAYFFPAMDLEDESTFFGIMCPVAGAFTSVRGVIGVNTIAGATPSEFALRNNTAATETSIDIAAGVTGAIADDASSLSISVDDVIGLRILGGGTSGALEPLSGLFQFDPTDDTYTWSVLGANNPSSTANSTDGTYYSPPVGVRESTTVEAETQYRCPIDCTIFYFQAISGTITSDGTTVLSVRVNGADPASGPSLSFTGADDGVLKVDKTNTAAVSAGDLISIKWVITGRTTGTTNMEKWAMWLRSANDEFLLVSGNGSGLRILDNVTEYYPVSGSTLLPANNTTQSLCDIDTPLAFTASKLHAKSDRETGTVADHTVTLLKDAVATSMVVTFSNGETGWDQDDVNTNSVSVDTALSYEIDLPIGGVNRDFNFLGIVCTNAVGRPPLSRLPRQAPFRSSLY